MKITDLQSRSSRDKERYIANFMEYKSMKLYEECLRHRLVDKWDWDQIELHIQIEIGVSRKFARKIREQLFKDFEKFMEGQP